MTFRPKVLVAKPNAELRWLGRFLMPGLFDGEHYFVLSQLGENRTRFVHGERFSGVLVPLVKSSLESATRAGFEAMKVRAESNSPHADEFESVRL